ncbi:hypothetical protein BT96DRAFT_915275 [Gymnopus androsaceus JB14]|uniref:Uncharacterized protein n=1 Tax=Gymnopus androsaceus JB14 TaxID=1447944 RepID=A0A6A4IB95_9AGAR|nr:hypothetical protein BT96DRAFT_915275 [Gymnopus androsaceus JB14]
MSLGFKCPTCGSYNFTMRIDVDSDAMKEELCAEYDPVSCGEVEEMLSLIDKDYQRCAYEISRLQLQVEALSSRQRQLKAYESKLRYLVAPIRKLPSEILILIFNHVSQHNYFREYPSLKSYLWRDGEDGLNAMPALVLSSVCSGWRRLALSYSTIWSRISLILDLKVSDHESNTERLGFFTTVQRYIDRSGTSLLWLRIDTRGDSIVSRPHPTLSLLGKQTHRWQHLTFYGNNYISREIFSIPKNVIDFPMLEDIEYDTVGRRSLEIFGQVPKVKTLKLETYIGHVAAANFPWRQLTSLDVAIRGRVSEVADLCPNVTKLRFQTFIVKRHSEADTPSPRAFRLLQSLSLVITNPLGETTWLDVILASSICPSLTSLTVERHILEDNLTPKVAWPLRTLETFLTLSSCALTSLSIQGLQLPDNDLIDIFKRLPSVATLTIQDPYLDLDFSNTITPTLIQSLHSTRHPSSNSPLLPKLRYLTLSYAGKVFDDAGFVDMIESRCLSNADALSIGIDPLRSLVLRSLHRTPTSLGEVAKNYEPLRLLDKQNGFRLIIKGVPPTAAM